jgi:GGDEF domain-containing protein
VRGSEAARSLSDVLWDELQEQPLQAARVAELSERLAQVASALGALAEPSGGAHEGRAADTPQRARSQRPREMMPAHSFSPGQSAASTPRTARVVHVASPRTAPDESEEPRERERERDRERDREQSPSPSAQGTPAPAAGSPSGAEASDSESPRRGWRDLPSAPVSAVLVDELAANEPLDSPSTQPPLADSPSPGADVEPAVEPAVAPQGSSQGQPLTSDRRDGGAPRANFAGEGTRSDRTRSERSRSDGWGAGRDSHSARFGGGPVEDAGIEIRDERREVPARVASDSAPPRAPWMASIMRRLERYEHDRLPFAVLLVELAGIERLRHAELPGEVARLTGLVEAALAEGLRPADSLTRETPGRYWLLAPETDNPGAKALAARLAGGVRHASHRGAPLQLAVGIAVCPDDGLQASALAAQADIALFAAQASGRAVAQPDEDV